LWLPSRYLNNRSDTVNEANSKLKKKNTVIWSEHILPFIDFKVAYGTIKIDTLFEATKECPRC
jgi:hypothetical protein